MAAEYGGAPATVAGRTYLTQDHLGSTRVVTDASGTVVERRDYLPFGDEVPAIEGSPRLSVVGYTNAAATTLKFTGKERDAETGLDWFDVRYLSSAQGRFTSPDPLFIAEHRIADPQLWNLYQYSRNNPLNLTDSTGLDVNLDCSKVSSEQCKQTVSDLNNRKDAQFQVSRNEKTGLLEAKVDDPSKLSKSEGELYKAINDTDNHATLQLTPFSSAIAGDQYAGKGLNILDRADLTQFGKAEARLPGEIIAHAAVEAYAGVGEGKGSYQDAHSFANQFFGNVAVGTIFPLPAGAALATSGHAAYNFQRVGTTVDVKKVFITPQPRASVPVNWERIRGNLVVSTTDKKK